MDIDKFYDWEKMHVAGIIYVMVKWMNIHHVEFTTTQRPKVESGIWYDITVKDENFSPIWNVSAQRLELLKERLIEMLDRKNFRKDYLERKAGGEGNGA